MSSPVDPSGVDVAELLDCAGALPSVQSNCMFQLALMMARVALEPAPQSYKDESAAALLALLRAKPKSNVVRLFGPGARRSNPTGSSSRSTRAADVAGA